MAIMAETSDSNDYSVVFRVEGGQGVYLDGVVGSQSGASKWCRLVSGQSGNGRFQEYEKADAKPPEHARITEQNVERAKLEDQITVIQGDAMEILPTLPGPFDLVFLDAEKTQYLDYLKAVENKLHQGSVVVADNVGAFQDQMQNYLHHVRNAGRYRSRTVETMLEFSETTRDAMEISEKRY